MRHKTHQLLSIVIPTFARENAAQKVLAYRDVIARAAQKAGLMFEVVVVDDGSDEVTKRNVESALRPHNQIKYLSLDANLGPGLARNAGVRLASGDWIWFLDDDDELEQSSTTNLLETLSCLAEDAEILAHSLNEIYGDDCSENRINICRRMLLFQEKQEVFNYILSANLIEKHAIKFSSGLHEDIRYLYQLMSAASKIKVLNEKVVQKNETPGAITGEMTRARIDGYITAFHEIIDLSSEVHNEVLDPKKFFSQTLGVMLYLIAKENTDKACLLLDYLKGDSFASRHWQKALQEASQCTQNATNFELATSYFCNHMQADSSKLVGELVHIFATRLSCKDLDSSLFLGPDEIRACCKRFFVDGEQKGDVVLLKAQEDIKLSAIQTAKDKLLADINAGRPTDCDGCPYLTRRAIKHTPIDYISLENFSYCNMRCTYCSPKYYGGTEAIYNAGQIIGELTSSSGALSDDCHVVWGGGEPTLSPRFEEINKYLQQLPDIGKVRVLTNSLRFSKSLQELLENKKVQIVTSIDSGSEALFREIRGKGEISSIVQNLKSYHEALPDKRRLTIKYILMPNNCSSSELSEYVQRISKGGLIDSLFQISCDFTLSSPSQDLVLAMYELATRLYSAGAQSVFFDDLIRDRVSITPEDKFAVLKHLRDRGMTTDFIFQPDSSEKIVLWGHGLQAHWYSKNTTSGRSGKILGTVGNAMQFQELVENDETAGLRIVPAGVQSMYEIIRAIEDQSLGHLLLRGSVL